ncbi:hypothetical protein EDC04DRAFT_2892502 [Pisolithus marmoratus]|nr:hypothetical protein EDC04DRAFT_2892502 [Pisolithus marmoratus]
MPGCAKSQSKKKQIASEYQEEALAQAIKLYKEEQEKPADEQKSLCQICQDVEMVWKKKNQLVKFNMEKNAWLTEEEEKMVVEFCLDYAT